MNEKYFPFIKILGMACVGIIVGYFISRAYNSQQSGSNQITQEPKTIVAFGDSLTAGFGVAEENSYPTFLQAKLHAEGYTNYTVINQGISGDTTAGALNRVDEVIADKPNIVIVVIGANDALRRMPADQAKTNIAGILERLQQEHITVILAGMGFPTGFGFEYFKGYDALYDDLAKQYDVSYIPSFLRGVALRSDLNTEDRIHPNASGYQKIVNENVWPILKEVLKK